MSDLPFLEEDSGGEDGSAKDDCRKDTDNG